MPAGLDEQAAPAPPRYTDRRPRVFPDEDRPAAHALVELREDSSGAMAIGTVARSKTGELKAPGAVAALVRTTAARHAVSHLRGPADARGAPPFVGRMQDYEMEIHSRQPERGKYREDLSGPPLARSKDRSRSRLRSGSTA